MAKRSSSHDEPAPAIPDDEFGSAPEGAEPQPSAVEPPPPGGETLAEESVEPIPVHDGTPLSKEHARQLLRGGHKLGVVGRPKTEWFGTARRLDEIVLATPFNQEVEDKLLDGVEVCLAE